MAKTLDPLVEGIRALVRRVLEDVDFIDYRARYPAKVIWQEGQTVSVQFDDDRLPPKQGVPLALPPGVTATIRPGTRVTVGWLDGSESKPRAFPEWDGGGGVRLWRQTVTTIDGDLVPVFVELEGSTAVRVEAPTVSAKATTKVRLECPDKIEIVSEHVNLGEANAASAVMLASAIPAQATMFGSMGASDTSLATALTEMAAYFTLQGAAAAAAACTAAATAATASATGVNNYAAQASSFAATKVRAT